MSYAPVYREQLNSILGKHSIAVFVSRKERAIEQVVFQYEVGHPSRKGHLWNMAGMIQICQTGHILMVQIRDNPKLPIQEFTHSWREALPPGPDKSKWSAWKEYSRHEDAKAPSDHLVSWVT